MWMEADLNIFWINIGHSSMMIYRRKSFGRKIWRHIIILLFSLLHVSLSRSTVETLPGFSGILPSKLETGYISVGEVDDVELFYYFFESERNPENDPLVLWLTGGPGCSGVTVFTDNKGPFIFDLGYPSNGSLPVLLSNPYSYTKIANLIFIDSPVLAGYSYATTNEGYYSSDNKAAKDATTFLIKWLLEYPEFHKNPLYIGGDSYAAILVPMVTVLVSQAIEAGDMANTNLLGYVVGNPMIDLYSPLEARVPYAYHMALISKEYFESAKSSCQGDYITRDPSNTNCLHDLQIIDECLKDIFFEHILQPICEYDRPKQSPEQMLLLPSQINENPKPCEKDVIEMFCAKWANNPVVQQAIHVRNGTLTSAWKRCNITMSAYEINAPNVIEYHRILSEKGYRALVYSGDHDLKVPYIDTLAWIRKLNLSSDETWRPWFVDQQVAGYTEKYHGRNGFSLTFAIVKGGGHLPSAQRPKETSSMVEKWFTHVSL